MWKILHDDALFFLSKLFGNRYARIILCIIMVGGAIVWNWDTIISNPSVVYLLEKTNIKQIPKADSLRYSVLIAHLGNDNNTQYERLIIEDFKETKGIQVLALNRSIPIDGPIPEIAESLGHEIARGYLKESGASVIIWGQVLSAQGNSILKLNITSSEAKFEKINRYDAPQIQAQLHLPSLFWSDLHNVLRLIIESKAAEFLYIEDTPQSPTFIGRVRSLLENNTTQANWTVADRINVQIVLAEALRIHGSNIKNVATLEEALSLYLKIIHEYPINANRFTLWRIRNNFACVLIDLGEIQQKSRVLEQAINIYTELLNDISPDTTPMEWITTNMNSSICWAYIGNITRQELSFKHSFQASREVFKTCPRDKFPDEWIKSHHNYGLTLFNYSELNDTITVELNAAISAFQQTLDQWPKGMMSRLWANTQLCLGNALTSLGRRTNDTTCFYDAINAYLAALSDLSPNHRPEEWANTQNGIGLAYFFLGVQTENSSLLRESISHFRNSLIYRDRVKCLNLWCGSNIHIAQALLQISINEDNMKTLEDCIRIYNDVIPFLNPHTNENLLQRAVANRILAKSLLKTLQTQRGNKPEM